MMHKKTLPGVTLNRSIYISYKCEGTSQLPVEQVQYFKEVTIALRYGHGNQKMNSNYWRREEVKPAHNSQV